MGQRRYTHKKRADQQATTRERIVRATMALHEELGPRDTTISAIAQRAGVQRLTVYRHFPDDIALFHACTTRWLELNPPPNPSRWTGETDALARTRLTLAAFYGYYRAGERMWAGAYRDRADVPALEEPMAAFESFLTQVRDELVTGWTSSEAGGGPLAATLGHGLRFPTWQSLNLEGLDDEEMAQLVADWVACIAGTGARGGTRE
jgi:AcrR family transcriptional regulator